MTAAEGGARFAGADWLERFLAAERIKKPAASPLGLCVADVLGQVFRGIYHLPAQHLRRAKWEDTWHVEVLTWRELATTDGAELSELVVLCHHAGLRLSVNPGTFRHLRLGFTPRKAEGGNCVAQPTMDERVAAIRSRLWIPPRWDTYPGAKVHPFLGEV